MASSRVTRAWSRKGDQRQVNRSASDLSALLRVSTAWARRGQQKELEGSHLLCPESLGGNGGQRPVNRNTSGREREAWQSGAGPRLWWATARVLYNLPAWFHAWFCEWGVSGATCLWSVRTTSPGALRHLLVELVDHHHLISGGGPKEVWT